MHVACAHSVRRIDNPSLFDERVRCRSAFQSTHTHKKQNPPVVSAWLLSKSPWTGWMFDLHWACHFRARHDVARLKIECRYDNYPKASVVFPNLETLHLVDTLGNGFSTAIASFADTSPKLHTLYLTAKQCGCDDLRGTRWFSPHRWALTLVSYLPEGCECEVILAAFVRNSWRRKCWP